MLRHYCLVGCWSVFLVFVGISGLVAQTNDVRFIFEQMPPLLFKWHHTYFSDEHPEDGIKIIDAGSEEIGLVAEKHWIKSRFRYANIKEQALVSRNGKYYDHIVITCANEKDEPVTRKIVFDVTDFHGKYVCGAWRFDRDDGSVLNGDILTEQVTSDGYFMAWEKSIGEVSGIMLVQVQDNMIGGPISKGPIVKGKMNGIWKGWRTGEGWYSVNYKNNVPDGIRLSWSADGKEMAKMWLTNGCLKAVQAPGSTNWNFEPNFRGQEGSKN
ncbi:MAG: hypothetical protein A2283_21620 [Lentisphaerae bacterium RIFOXYA12_FULL_48_11]|nr:MAG: hypothetical protein A2283_21620 [Lentisphaerae bacterium RIFOXYA12_FULL_48_11]